MPIPTNQTSSLSLNTIAPNHESQANIITLVAALLLSVTALAIHSNTEDSQTATLSSSTQTSKSLANTTKADFPDSLRIAALHQELINRIEQSQLGHYMAPATSESSLVLTLQSELLFEEGSIELGRAGIAALDTVLTTLDFTEISLLIDIAPRRDLTIEFSQTHSFEQLQSAREKSVGDFLASRYSSLSSGEISTPVTQ